MTSIQHLSKDEQLHFILCHCGEYIDMRNLQEVLYHQHLAYTPTTNWDYSIKKGEATAYLKNGKQLDLN